jgi:hypothetical protein
MTIPVLKLIPSISKIHFKESLLGLKQISKPGLSSKKFVPSIVRVALLVVGQIL